VDIILLTSLLQLCKGSFRQYLLKIMESIIGIGAHDVTVLKNEDGSRTYLVVDKQKSAFIDLAFVFKFTFPPNYPVLNYAKAFVIMSRCNFIDFELFISIYKNPDLLFKDHTQWLLISDPVLYKRTRWFKRHTGCFQLVKTFYLLLDNGEEKAEVSWINDRERIVFENFLQGLKRVEIRKKMNLTRAQLTYSVQLIYDHFNSKTMLGALATYLKMSKCLRTEEELWHLFNLTHL